MPRECWEQSTSEEFRRKWEEVWAWQSLERSKNKDFKSQVVVFDKYGNTKAQFKTVSGIV